MDLAEWNYYSTLGKKCWVLLRPLLIKQTEKIQETFKNFVLITYHSVNLIIIKIKVSSITIG